MTILALHDLTVSIGRSRPVDGVNLSVAAGEMLGIVGESGSGKSLTMKSVIRLLPPTARVTGQILWQGRDLASLSEAAMREVRGREIAMIFQEPMTALNPVLTVGLQITESLNAHLGIDGSAANKRAVGVVAGTCDRVAVMYAGRIMESGSVEAIFTRPSHAYTLGLLRSLPGLQHARERLDGIAGTPPDPSALPPGCAFAPRCGFAIEVCRSAAPPLVPVTADQRSACIRAGDVQSAREAA
jgi:oligopeptide/dipeptide ABC transporter ATP-binding protein